MLKIFITALVIWGSAAVATAQQVVFDRERLPEPVYGTEPGYLDLYWTAWQQAWDHVKIQPGLVQPRYMDEGLWDDTIWIWDSEFMVLYCKYAPDMFPGIETLDNFYYTTLEQGTSSLRIQHPDNPPFYAWVENEYYAFTADQEHMSNLLSKKRFLQRYYDWFEALTPGKKLHFDHTYIAMQRRPLGYYWRGVMSGMDNTPRGRGEYDNLLWIDAISQQALSALYISRMCNEFGEKKDAKLFAKRYTELKKLINKYYWDKEDGFYYDLRERDTSFVKVVTPASFWAMLAEVPTKKQAQRMAEFALQDSKLGGIVPWVTVARDDADFNAEHGDYWRGGMWLPTAYMGVKALEKYGLFEEANTTAKQVLEHQFHTFKQYEPSTIWECYRPNTPEPSINHGERVREDFCGWSALGPISLFIENVLGFYKADGVKRELYWNMPSDNLVGIKRLRFGDIKTDVIANDDEIKVVTNAPYKLYINGKKYAIRKGETILKRPRN
ncbi:MAG: MGH1-like glycoside hydrolase domain-containing protein [Marinifilaceae bacterium]